MTTTGNLRAPRQSPPGPAPPGRQRLKMPIRKHWRNGLAKVPDSFLKRVNIHPDGCWEWTGATDTSGYGRYRYGGRHEPTHRLLWKLTVADVAGDLELDHLCRNRVCCNPDHLEPVSRRENTLRGEGPTAVLARKTHCKRGHPLSGANLYTYPNGKRLCRECERMRKRAR